MMVTSDIIKPRNGLQRTLSSSSNRKKHKKSSVCSAKKTQKDKNLTRKCTGNKLPQVKTRPSSSVNNLYNLPGRSSPPVPTSIVPPFERRRRVPLLTAIKPENEKTEKERFMRAHYIYNPLFLYRYPADVSTMVRFSQASDRYLTQSILIMEKTLETYGSYEIFEEETGGIILTRPQIYSLVKKYLKKEDLEAHITVNLSEDLISRGSMTLVKGKPTLNVRVVNLREQWAEGLLRHELGTHYLRSWNNQFQLWANIKTRKEIGLKPFNPTEEGLASLHSVLTRPDPLLWRAALLYYTAYKASIMPFKELFHDLGRFVKNPDVRWDYCIRAKRGQSDTSKPGGFSKDQVYLDGALQILKRRRSIDFSLLVRLGKISLKDIELLHDISDLEHTRIPSFMNDKYVYRKYINRIADANGLTDEILRDVD